MKERKKLFTDIPISTISGFLRENFSSREGRIFEMERLNFAEGGKRKLAGKKLHRAHEQSKYLEESRGLAELGT